MPTLVDILVDKTAPRFSEDHARVAAGFLEAANQLLRAISSMTVAIGESARQRQPAEVYRAFLESEGMPPGTAGMLASLLVSVANRTRQDRADHAAAARAIRYFATAGGHRNAALKHARALLAAADATSFCDDLFCDPRILASQGGQYLQSEFQSILHIVASSAGGADISRLKAIAATLVPFLPSRRGRNPGPATYGHELLHDGLESLGRGRAYTLSHSAKRGHKYFKFPDAATRATAEQFGVPNFDPRPAVLRRGRPKGR